MSRPRSPTTPRRGRAATRTRASSIGTSCSIGEVEQRRRPVRAVRRYSQCALRSAGIAARREPSGGGAPGRDLAGEQPVGERIEGQAARGRAPRTPRGRRRSRARATAASTGSARSRSQPCARGRRAPRRAGPRRSSSSRSRGPCPASTELVQRPERVGDRTCRVGRVQLVQVDLVACRAVAGSRRTRCRT